MESLLISWLALPGNYKPLGASNTGRCARELASASGVNRCRTSQKLEEELTPEEIITVFLKIT